MLNSLQILRALAAWMVVFHHIVQSYFMGKEPNLFWALSGQYGTFGVDIFFVLSGFVMGLIAQKYTQHGTFFLANRIYRIYPVYLFYTVLLLFSLWVFPAQVYLTQWDWHSLPASLALIPNLNPNGHGYVPTLYVGWTLSYEMFFYLIFSFVLLLKLPKPAITCAVILMLFPLIYDDNTFLGHGALLLIEFAFGLMLFSLFQKTRNFPLHHTLLLSGLTLLGSTVAAWVFKENVGIFKALLAANIVLLFIVSEPFFSNDKKYVRLLVQLGNYSYSTYLNHIIIIGWFYALFGTKTTGLTSNIGIVLCLITIYIVSKASYIYVENNTWLQQSKHKLLKHLPKP